MRLCENCKPKEKNFITVGKSDIFFQFKCELCSKNRLSTQLPIKVCGICSVTKGLCQHCGGKL